MAERETTSAQEEKANGWASDEDVWPRPPFYLRFPWILAGPLVVATILWLAAGVVLASIVPQPDTSLVGRRSVQVASPPAALPTATAVPATPTPTTEPTPTPRPRPTPFAVAVYNTGGAGVFISETAGGGGRKIKAWPERTIFQVIGDDQRLYGQTWRSVRDPDGNEGWVPAQFLVDPASLPSGPAAPAPRSTAPATLTPTGPTSTPTALPSPTALRSTPTPPSAAPTAARGMGPLPTAQEH